MKGESLLAWIKIAAIVAVLILIAFAFFWTKRKLESMTGAVGNWFAEKSAAYDAWKAEIIAKRDAPHVPEPVYTVRENPAGAATGIVLPMRRRVTTPAEVAPPSPYSINPRDRT